MHHIRKIMFGMALFVLPAWGQTRDVTPRVGYLYPAGARQGATVEIMVGGQFLRGTKAVHVSGTGVHATVVRVARPLGNIRGEQRAVLMKRMADVLHARLAEAGVDGKVVAKMREKVEKRWEAAKKKLPELEKAKPLDHPILDGLEAMSIRELAHVKNYVFFPRQKQQPNRQIAETVLIKIVVDADAPPGDRELRLSSRTGLTNPVVFQVGQMREVTELEPNDHKGGPDLSKAPQLARVKEAWKLMERPVHDVPVLLNGQILPGDIDRWAFRAQKGQKLVIDVDARQLVPYLADAVPGWFQATLAIYDAEGREVAFVDDFRFHPDPVMLFAVPEDGEYELEIRDSIHRGREDFVYRIAIGEQPFVTHIFPLGGRQGAPLSVAVKGWNLTETQISLDTKPGNGGWLRLATSRSGGVVSNAVPYAANILPECMESATRIAMPMIVNGRIEKPGDVDVFRIEGKAGDEIVAEVVARRLGSPLDSLVRLTDAAGKVLAWNDDYVAKQKFLHVDRLGLVTHHADSYLMAKLPKDGVYYVQISDAQNHGSDAHAYRLRISAPRPDFALRVTPSSLFVRPGIHTPIGVYVLRRDGFDGEIEVKAPEGFVVAGGRIPAGRDFARMTITAVGKPSVKPIALWLVGDAQQMSRVALGADNTMQAFLFRHLVPAKEMMVVSPKQKGRPQSLALATAGPVRIPVGGSQNVVMKVNRGKALIPDATLELADPPAGLRLRDMSLDGATLTFTLSVDADAKSFSGNVIVGIIREFTPKAREGAAPKKKRRTRIGYLPAIPVEIVAK